jgi:hypothetical protein
METPLPPNRQQRRRAARTADAANAYSKTQQWADRKRHQLLMKQAASTTVEVLLPSSLSVSAKRMSLSAMLEFQEIPNALLPIVSGWISAFRSNFDDVEARDEAIADIITAKRADYLAVARFVWCKCVDEPSFVEGFETDPSTNEQILDDAGAPIPCVKLAEFPELESVDELDLLYLFDWAQGVNQTVGAWFRARQREDIPTLETSGTMGNTAG